MHGGAGLAGWNGVTNEWARVLNEAGVSTFNLDGFTGRQKFTPAEQAALPAIIRMHDAYAALSVLSKHPLVDADKIVVMGFSQGSVAAMYANLTRFQKQYGPSAKFAAHISVYGICSIKYREDEDLQSPLLMLHGAADDWVPAEPCAEYAERLTKGGKNVRLISYQDAFHGFDGPAVGPVKKFDLATGGYCRLQESNNGSIVNSETQKPLADGDACRRKGVSLGYNETAMKKAHEDVVTFLGGIFK
jgi:dienelactone hydrolase